MHCGCFAFPVAGVSPALGDDAGGDARKENKQHARQGHRRQRFVEEHHADDFGKGNDGELKAGREHHVAVGEGAGHGDLGDHRGDAHAQKTEPDVRLVHFQAPFEEVAAAQAPDDAHQRKVKDDA